MHELPVTQRRPQDLLAVPGPYTDEPGPLADLDVRGGLPFQRRMGRHRDLRHQQHPARPIVSTIAKVKVSGRISCRYG